MTDSIKRGPAGGSLVLPEGMSLQHAAKIIGNQLERDEYSGKLVTVVETIRRFPFDAAQALKQAADELFGGILQHDKVLPDGRTIEAKMISIRTSPTDLVQVPWGPFHIQNIDGEFETQVANEDGLLFLKLLARVPRKNQDDVAKLAARTREILAVSSIYRNKALKMQFRNDEGKLEAREPVFMDIAEGDNPIFSRAVQRELNINLLAPIRKAARARKLKVPKKRTALLKGTYGTGKTLTARMMAREALAAGRTFIYVADARELPEALLFARDYSPAFVFVEDIDRVVFGSRTAEMDRLLNIVDGVDTKEVDIVTVLTTNNLEFIHPAFLREGRTDCIIDINEPDVDSAMALMNAFSGGILVTGDPRSDSALFKTAQIVVKEKRTPAFIREVVERAKLALLDLPEKEGAEDDIRLTGQDIESALNDHMREREGIEQAFSDFEMLQRSIDVVRSMQGGGKLRAA